MDETMDTNFLTLSLSSPSHHHAAVLPPPPLPLFTYPPLLPVAPEPVPPHSHHPTPRRPRRRQTGTPPPGKPATIPPPYPWAGDRRCAVLTLRQLHSKKIFLIGGDVQCKKCDGRYRIQYNLEDRFRKVADFVFENVEGMRQRAPKAWMSPALLNCELCKAECSVRPVISERKKNINWLFLLLGQTLGCCTLEQLKYFCKHTGNHRTGAKDRVLFLAYMGLCSQVDPDRAF